MQIRYSMRKDGEAEASGCSNDSFLLSLPTVRRRREKAKQLTPPANLYFYVHVGRPSRCRNGALANLG